MSYEGLGPAEVFKKLLNQLQLCEMSSSGSVKPGLESAIRVLKEPFQSSSNEALIALVNDAYKSAAGPYIELQRLLQECLEFSEDECRRNWPTLDESNSDSRSKKVFIVHGHDTNLLELVKSFLLVNGFEPIVLMEQPDKGLTIIEKFVQYSDVPFAVVLMTKDDTGRAISEATFRFRPRQNVIFEHGYFIGKLGRDRVAVIREDEIDNGSDFSGIIYMTTKDWPDRLLVNLRPAPKTVPKN